MTVNQVVIGIGSNIEPEKHIRRVKQIFLETFGSFRESRFVETEPVGSLEQPNYLNGALLIETPLARPELQEWLRQTESRLGRKRSSDRYASRTIDLDILVWNGTIVDPEVHERWFLENAVSELVPGCLKKG